MRPVRAERSPDDPTLMPFEGDGARPLAPQIPHPRGFVLGRRDDMRPVRAERRGANRTLMTFEGDEGRPLAPQIPHPRRFVIGRGDNMRPVRAERSRTDQTAVTRQRRLTVPEPYLLQGGRRFEGKSALTAKPGLGQGLEREQHRGWLISRPVRYLLARLLREGRQRA